MVHSSFHERVAILCGDCSRALSTLAEDLERSGDTSGASLSRAMARQLERLALDALEETQPIPMDLRDDELGSEDPDVGDGPHDSGSDT